MSSPLIGEIGHQSYNARNPVDRGNRRRFGGSTDQMSTIPLALLSPPMPHPVLSPPHFGGRSSASRTRLSEYFRGKFGTLDSNSVNRDLDDASRRRGIYGVAPWCLLMLFACGAIPAKAGEDAEIAASTTGHSDLAKDVDFGRDVRPILSAHCFACHGPDENDRQADVRLDTAEGIADVVDPDDFQASILLERVQTSDEDLVMPPAEFHKPLNAEQKAILSAWISEGASFSDHWSFAPLRADRPTNEHLDTESNQPQASSTIDEFLHARILDAGLPVNGQANRYALLRRVSLDLTGMPPSESIARDFLADSSPDAYETLVDRLLEEPAYGEHMARYWLDLVRFADTHGLHLDNYREMWPYRDWVIDAFSRNKPFDEFVTEQLAGDLLPNATRDQKIASGFNRLNVTTNEGGSIYDEVFTRNVIDRTDAFGTIFLGLTVGCAVCHDHKFDPITSEDYYSLSAYFNSLDGSAMDGNNKAPAPVMQVTTSEQDQQIAEHLASLNALRKKMNGPLDSVDRAQSAWENSVLDGGNANHHVLQPFHVESKSGVPLKVMDDHSVALNGEAHATDVTTIIAAVPPGIEWQTLHLEAIPSKQNDRVGASDNGNVVLSEIRLDTTVGDEDSLSEADWIPVEIRHGFADIEQDGDDYAVRYAYDGKEDSKTAGWAVAGHQQPGGRNAWFMMPSIGDERPSLIRIQLKYLSQFGKHQFQRVRIALSDGPASIPESSRVVLGDWHSIGPFEVEGPDPAYNRTFASRGKEFDADKDFTYRERNYRWQHRGDLLAVTTNRLPTIPERTTATLLHQTIQSPSPQKVELMVGTDDGHVVYLNGKKIGQSKVSNAKPSGDLRPLNKTYTLPLRQGSNRLYVKVVNHVGDSRFTFAYRSAVIATPPSLAKFFAKPKEQRSKEEKQSLQRYYRHVQCIHPDWLALVGQEKALVKTRQDYLDSMPTTLIWKETKEPRQANLLMRGQYDAKGPEVPRATPSFLPSMSDDLPNNRLGLAQWLTDPSHPLTARVAVNRFWQQLFGVGLVKTSEDFGSQGEPPSHPLLLDWLAQEFIQSRWDVKSLMKTMVMTDAYRRSTRVTLEHLELDPENRLLARGPRFRLDAEVLRDQALALSGLLVDRRGGKSVKPPQPKGLWYAVGYTRSNTANFVADEGDDIFRRSLYVFWKRTSPPPQMSTFDAPSRESCTARRERTNTPLQALVMLNEEQYLQAAKQLASITLNRSELDGPEERLSWLFRHVTLRPIEPDELSEIRQLLDDLLKHYQNSPELVSQLVGEQSAEQAAWTVLASTLLNLDEVVTK